MCTFGDRLQEKCEARGKFEAVLERELTSQEQSVDKKRQAQWESVQKVRCALERFIGGGSVEPPEGGGVTASCEDKIDYLSDVGFIDDLKADQDRLALAQQFTCEEKSVSFSGFWWSTGPTSNDYVKHWHDDVDVTITPIGASPFDFCDAAAAHLDVEQAPASLSQSLDGERIHHGEEHSDTTSARRFTSCGKHSGPHGPRQRDCDKAYNGTQLNGAVDVARGYQLWTVPSSGVYELYAGGANGGMLSKGVPGKGARAGAAFRLKEGDQLVVVVGQRGK